MFTWLEIDARAIQYNLKQFRKLIGPKVLLMPVVKANAYGHGFLLVAKICQQAKEADRICVVNLDEALELIKAGITKKSIMILSFYDLDKEKLLKAIKRDIIFPIYRLDQIQTLNKIGKLLNKKVKVHLKIDTGTSRLGILPKQAIDFVKKIKKYKFLNLEGLWSHFASSEESRAYTEKQIKIFNKVSEDLEKIDIKIPIKHFACSAAMALYRETRFNAVRLGISLYGLYSAALAKSKIKLKPALSWYTKIIQIKILSKGTRIGYGGAYITKQKTKLAILPIGYWDGYDRRFSNKSFVLIRGKKCPVRGRVCMNLTIIDVTDVFGVRVGDKATLIGYDRDQKIIIDDLAKWANTINYEITDRINPFLPRILNPISNSRE